jgi:hypothetical protein
MCKHDFVYFDVRKGDYPVPDKWLFYCKKCLVIKGVAKDAFVGRP